MYSYYQNCMFHSQYPQPQSQSPTEPAVYTSPHPFIHKTQYPRNQPCIRLPIHSSTRLSTHGTSRVYISPSIHPQDLVPTEPAVYTSPHPFIHKTLVPTEPAVYTSPHPFIHNTQYPRNQPCIHLPIHSSTRLSTHGTSRVYVSPSIHPQDLVPTEPAVYTSPHPFIHKTQYPRNQPCIRLPIHSSTRLSTHGTSRVYVSPIHSSTRLSTHGTSRVYISPSIHPQDLVPTEPAVYTSPHPFIHKTQYPRNQPCIRLPIHSSTRLSTHGNQPCIHLPIHSSTRLSTHGTSRVYISPSHSSTRLSTHGTSRVYISPSIHPQDLVPTEPAVYTSPHPFIHKTQYPRNQPCIHLPIHSSTRLSTHGTSRVYISPSIHPQDLVPTEPAVYTSPHPFIHKTQYPRNQPCIHLPIHSSTRLSTHGTSRVYISPSIHPQDLVPTEPAVYTSPHPFIHKTQYPRNQPCIHLPIHSSTRHSKPPWRILSPNIYMFMADDFEKVKLEDKCSLSMKSRAMMFYVLFIHVETI